MVLSGGAPTCRYFVEVLRHSVGGHHNDWGIAPGIEWVGSRMPDVFLWAAQIRSTKNLPLTCVFPNVPRVICVVKIIIYNESNL